MTTTADLRDRLVAVVNTNLPEGKTIAAEGTGGNCEAYIVKLNDGRSLYITDGDACLPYDDPEYWLDLTLGYYDADDEEDGYLTIKADLVNGKVAVNDSYWNNVVTSIKAWVEGDPYRDVEGNEVLDDQNRPVSDAEPQAANDPEVRVNVYLTLHQSEVFEGWNNDHRSLEASLKARLDEIYGDNGGAYSPHVLGIEVQ